MKRFVTLGINSKGKSELIFGDDTPVKKQLEYVQGLKKDFAKCEYSEVSVYSNSIKTFVKPVVKKEETEEVKEKAKK